MVNNGRFTSDFEGVLLSQANTPPKGADVRAIVRFFQRRIILILAITLGTAAFMTSLALLAKPRYVAETVVLLGTSSANVADAESVTKDVQVSPEIVRSELDVIKSREVVERVIQQLNLANDPEFNPAASKLSLAYWRNKDMPAAERAKRRRAAMEENVLGRLEVDNDGRSFGLHISFMSDDPNKAALIANTFAEQYLARQLEQKYSLASKAGSWLDSRLSDLRSEATTADKATADFRATAGLDTVGDSLDNNKETVAAHQLNDLNAALTEAKTNLYQAESRLQAAQSAGQDNAPEVQSSPVIQNLKSQEGALRQSKAELLTRYGPEHPQVMRVDAQAKEVHAKIQDEAHKIMQGLGADVVAARSKLTAIQRTLSGLSGQVSGESRARVTLNDLERQAEAKNALYEEFLKRSSQVAQQTTLQIPDAKIVAAAKAPIVATFPKKKILILAGFTLGGMLGVLVAMLIEYMDPTFRNSAQIERSLNTHVIGLLPDLRATTALRPENYVLERPNSLFTESLRIAWTDLNSQVKGAGVRSVAITSTAQSEGKTTYCLCLARMLATGGRKVLLVDADMRRPNIGAALGLEPRNGGLPAYLSGEKPLSQILQADSKVENLYLLLSNSGTVSAAELLSNRELTELIDTHLSEFDLIIFDTPPAGAVADAALISRSTDFTLFVMQWGRVPETEVARAIRQFKSSGGHVNGVALTQVNLNKYRKYVDGYSTDLYSSYYLN
jgi:capsular exopolysaccharide synthesis family protein